MRRYRHIWLLLLPPLIIWLLIALFSSSRIDWQQSQWLTIYLLNSDGSATSEQYIAHLSDEDFLPIAHFINQQASFFRQQKSPVLRVRIAPPIKNKLPNYPVTGDFFDRVLWSLQIRWWRMKLEGAVGLVIILQFYDPDISPTLSHSIGLPKLGLGLVKAFSANEHASLNNVVATHELLHLLGASDKYDLDSGLPLYPQGYAEPRLLPRYPQSRAEIMGGGIPLDEETVHMPYRLGEVIIGTATAKELGWVD